MKRSLFHAFLLSLLLPGLFSLQSCKQEGCTDPDAVNYDADAKEGGVCVMPELMIHFHPMIGSQDYAANTTYTINGVAVQFTAIQFYVSGIELGDASDFDAPDTYLLVKAGQMMYDVGEITAGTKPSLRFNVGIDSVTNHLDPSTYEATNPLAFQSPSMHWSWDSGYIFFRIDGKVDTDADGTPDTDMQIHIGKDSFLTPVALTLDDEVDSESHMINIMMDFSKAFTGVDPATEYLTHTGDNPALAAKVAANIPSIFMAE